jgi:hypothetical protein
MVEGRRARDIGLILRLNAEERRLLETLAGAMGLKLSDTLRQCIRAEAKRRGLIVPARSAARSRRP